MPPESRPMSYSRGEISTFVMPHMQNVRGDLFGGELMALVDQAAAVAAIRHAGGPAVTASIERVDFRERIPVGALVTCMGDGGLRGQLVDGHHGRGVRRERAAAVSGGTPIPRTSCSSRSTSRDSPKRVPRLVPETPEEQARYARARRASGGEAAA